MVNSEDIYMVDYVRTPFSRSRPGNPDRSAFSDYKGYELVGLTLRNLFEERLKGKLEPKEISEFIVGCALPVGSNWPYGGRNAWFAGNMPYDIPSIFIDRACGSAMTAMHYGVMSIMTGYNDIVIASGFEHMFAEPLNPQFQTNSELPSRLVSKGENNPFYRDDVDIITGFQMPQTAQKLFEEEVEHFTVEDMDCWGVRSHQRAHAALEEGFFKDEIVPVKIQKNGNPEDFEWVSHDLSILKNVSYEKTAILPSVSSPGFRGGYKNKKLSRKEYKEKLGTSRGVIKAGNSSPLNAGAATCVLMNDSSMEAHQLKPMAKIISMGWAAVDPSVMGRGPVPATEMALKKAGMTADEIDFWEINEAFSIVTLNAIKELGIDPEKVNIKGGAIAIGHPLGASGVRLPGTLARILQKENARYGCANLCCGGGQGVALVIENPYA